MAGREGQMWGILGRGGYSVLSLSGGPVHLLYLTRRPARQSPLYLLAIQLGARPWGAGDPIEGSRLGSAPQGWLRLKGPGSQGTLWLYLERLSGSHFPS